MDGYTFLSKVRSRPEYADTTIIMVTSESHKDNVLQAIKAGVNDYLVKPFDNDAFKAKIGGIIEKLSGAA